MMLKTDIYASILAAAIISFFLGFIWRGTMCNEPESKCQHENTITSGCTHVSSSGDECYVYWVQCLNCRKEGPAARTAHEARVLWDMHRNDDD